MLLIITLILAVIAGALILKPKHSDLGERLSEAGDELSGGIEDAGKQLQDHSPAERFGDAVEDAGEKIQDSAQ